MENIIDYGFCDYLAELWNIYSVRSGMSLANAARRVLDIREDALVAYLDGVSVQQFYLEDIEEVE